MRIRNFGALVTLIGLTAMDSYGLDSPATKPKFGPAGSPYAITLSASHGYFQSVKHPAPDFWALIGYYIPQYSETACSAASLSMVLNAARTSLLKTSEDKLILQPNLVEKTDVEHWKERLSEPGYGPKKLHGTTLEVLRKIAEKAFQDNGFTKAAVEAVHVNDLSEKNLSKIHQLLITNEKSSNDFILANFNQQTFTDDSDAGHFAPVGAYDSETKKVLILDPDREWYEPYWVSEKKFVEGLHTKDSENDDYRGLLVIRLNSNRPR
jgi:hypothetical protein